METNTRRQGIMPQLGPGTKTTWCREIKLILFLSIPKTIELLCNVTLPFLIITAYAGRISVYHMAVAVLACSTYRGTARILFRGLGVAVQTLFGQAYGAGEYRLLGLNLQRATVITITVSILTACILYIPSEYYFKWLGQNEELAKYAHIFLLWIIPFIIFDGIFWVQSSYLLNQRKPLPGMFIAILLGILQFPIVYCICEYVTPNNYIMGLAFGYGIAMVFRFILMTIVIMCWHKTVKRTIKNPWYGWSFHCFTKLGPIVRLMVYSTTSQIFKSWGLEYLVLLAGIMENPELSVGAIGIAFYIYQTGGIGCIGLSWGIAARVAAAVGSSNKEQAQHTVRAGALIGIIWILAYSALVIGFRNKIAYIWTNDQSVVDVVSTLCWISSAINIIDAPNAIGNGILIGVRRQRSSFWVTIVSALCFCATLPPFYAFKLEMGVVGLLLGYLSAVTFEAIINSSIVGTMNWDNQIERAKHNIQAQLMKQLQSHQVEDILENASDESSGEISPSNN